jgi:hypothetical protein
MAACLALLALAAAPPPCLACSCAEVSITDWIGDPQYAIFTGTAAPQVGDNVPVVVSHWFQGPGAAAVVLTATGTMTNPDGTVTYNTCGTTLEAGDSWIVVAHVQGTGRLLEPGLCLPHARLDTQEGQQMLAAVVAELGGGAEPSASPEAPEGAMLPPTPAVTPLPPSVAGPFAASPLLLGLAASAILGSVGGAVLVVARRSRPG